MQKTFGCLYWGCSSVARTSNLGDPGFNLSVTKRRGEGTALGVRREEERKKNRKRMERGGKEREGKEGEGEQDSLDKWHRIY